MPMDWNPQSNRNMGRTKNKRKKTVIKEAVKKSKHNKIKQSRAKL